MFNWLFGKKEDVVINASTVEVRHPTQNEIESQIEKQLFNKYGDKRSYTFPDGKTITWEVKIDKVWGRCEIKDTVLEYINGERFYCSDTQLKDLPELSPPALQLFLILVNDQRNIKYSNIINWHNPKHVYTHTKLGIVVEKDVHGFSIKGLGSLTARDMKSIELLYDVYKFVFDLKSRRTRYEFAMKKRAKSIETRKLDAYLKTIAK